MGSKASAAAKELASTQADVHIARERLTQIQTSASRLVEDIDQVLKKPPFAPREP